MNDIRIPIYIYIPTLFSPQNLFEGLIQFALDVRLGIPGTN